MAIAKKEIDQALFKASQSGNLEETQKAIQEGADVNAKDKAGWTPLHFASVRGHGNVAQLLINKGADVNVETFGSRWTPLWLAINNNRLEVIRLLIKCGGKAH